MTRIDGWWDQHKECQRVAQHQTKGLYLQILRQLETLHCEYKELYLEQATEIAAEGEDTDDLTNAELAGSEHIRNAIEELKEEYLTYEQIKAERERVG
jgi:hypothetical protein